MIYKLLRPLAIKQYARFILLVFMVSVFNVSLQVPAHAAMKMQMQMQQSNMQQVSDCHCPPPLCDSVLALDNQSVDGVVSLPKLKFRISTLIEVLEQNAGQPNQKQHIERLSINASSAAPPALLIKTLLLI